MEAIKYVVWPDETYVAADDFEWENSAYSYKSDDYSTTEIPIDVEEGTDEFDKYIKNSQRSPSHQIPIQKLALPGATRDSYIKRWIEMWFHVHASAPSYREVVNSIEGILIGWHQVIGSTPPDYLCRSGLISDIYRAGVKTEAACNPWLKNTVLKGTGVSRVLVR